LTVEGGELTPTLKGQTPIVDEKYASVIDRIYANSELSSGKEAGADFSL